MSGDRLRIGFIPLADAAALIIAADKGFTAAEGLDVELVREVSWSNIRDKLNIGVFDAAHLIAPVAIASTLGLGHVKVPIVAPFGLGVNGNAITVSPALHAAISTAARRWRYRRPDGVGARARAGGRAPQGRRRGAAHLRHDVSVLDPQLSTALLDGGGRRRSGRGRAARGVAAAHHMVESLVNQHVDGFCVGAPWNSVAVDLGIGFILHFGSEILVRAAEKVLGVRARWAQENPDVVRRLVRAHRHAAAFIENIANRDEVAALLAAPHRIDVAPEVIRRTLDGRLKVAPDGAVRSSERYLLFGRENAARPDSVQSAWLYAQMVRWGQAPLSAEMLAAANSVFRADLYDAALAECDTAAPGRPADGIGAFAGPAFDPHDIAAHLATWDIQRNV